MANREARIEELRKKYGDRGVDTALRIRPADFPELMEWRDELDQHYTKLWFDFTYGGLLSRGVLDDRTRILVLIGMCTVLEELEQLENHIRSALHVGATPREVLEVILQATIYAGNPPVIRAQKVFRKVAEELNLLDEIKRTQLPLEGNDPDRTIEQDRPTWKVPDSDFPRREELMKKYGWRGIGAGIRLQPTHHVPIVEWLDKIDQHFLKVWEDFIYAGMYTRDILDNRTRILVMVGECVALAEWEQAQNHMRCAVLFGATPREVMEVLLHSTMYVGMPRGLTGARLWCQILEREGRLNEITETQLPLPETES